jgi:hypothetical protein
MMRATLFCLLAVCVAAAACPKASDNAWGRGDRPVILVSWDDDRCSTYSAASADLDTTHRGCSSGANDATLAGVKSETPRPTLEQLRCGTPWAGAVCEHCMHRKPVAFVPYIIRWGPDASSDMLRRSARCTKCGRKGAALQYPSWAGSHIGWEPFPSAR